MHRPPEKWLTAKHATLIHVSDPVAFDDPFPFPKRDPRAWVVLDTPLHDGNRQLTETNSCTVYSTSMTSWLFFACPFLLSLLFYFRISHWVFVASQFEKVVSALVNSVFFEIDYLIDAPKRRGLCQSVTRFNEGFSRAPNFAF